MRNEERGRTEQEQERGTTGEERETGEQQAWSRVQRWLETELGPMGVIYEDEVMLVVDKPAGLPSQGTLDRRRDHVLAAVRRDQGLRRGAQAYVALHHRLDAGTSGVLVMSLSKAANKGLAQQFARHSLEKCYRAVTWSEEQLLPQRWEVDNHLGHLGGGSWGAVHSGGARAQTRFELAAQRADAAGVLADWQAWPKTGRTHQVRVHLAQAGRPIVGDGRYGGRAGERLMLHAWRLRMRHPLSRWGLVFEAALPSSWPLQGPALETS
ncbi:MAG: RluA family pseudouridine synthase [Myxococcota bacterium]|jgi:RluA family pseudouridine synthase|nr:RluA family pseudouridine synthase [Myxococcota bacterium]